MANTPRLSARTRDIAEAVRAGLTRVYGPRLKAVYVYGSYARGEAREGSDLDLLVVLSSMDDVGTELSAMSETGSRLSLSYDVTISLLPVTEEEFRERRTPLLLNVRREAVPV